MSMLQSVCDALDSGVRRLTVEAVPGAGKTHLLRTVAARGRTLILAYNALLAAETNAQLHDAGLEERAVCVTFHGLCGRHLGVARDDAELDARVDGIERGVTVPTSWPSYEQVLIDEAQDVRSLYVRLLRSLRLLETKHVVLVVGDRRQLVYDFDVDFPASLDVLCAPPRAVAPGLWTRVVANETRRLTRSMCGLVNGVFGTRIYTDRDGPPVELRCPRSAFDMHETLRDLDGPYLLLVDRRRHNAPLRVLLDSLSRAGVTVHVHGVDSGEALDERVRCATYWSAKGVQHDTVVVLLPGAAPANPMYVALTRACRRLVLVLDPRDPHAAVCAYAAAHPTLVSVVGPHARDAVARGRHGDVSASLEARPRGARSVVALDSTVPRASSVRAACVVTDVVLDNEDDVNTLPDATDDDDGALLAQMARTWAEWRAVGRCRAVADAVVPCRMNVEMRDTAVLGGYVGRAVAPYPGQALATDLVDATRSAEATMRVAEDDIDAAWTALARTACAALTWDAFEHLMRQRPVPLNGAHNTRVDWVRRQIPVDAEFDTRLIRRRDGVAYHVRVHARTDVRAYHVVWDASSSDVAHAATRACLHPNGVCRVLAMATCTATDVVVQDASALWHGIVESTS